LATGSGRLKLPGMPYYLCGKCETVRHEDEPRPFVWCDCGEILDGVALVEDLNRLDERLRQQRRFRREPVPFLERR
jgi:hypothetical protein